MRRLLLALALCAAPSLAGAQALTPQEQILLAGPLADPATAKEYAADSDPVKWRARLVGFCKNYKAHPPTVNEKARSLKDAMTPAQWAMLMATIRALKKSDSWADQAKLKIFVGMIEDADEGLKNGDPADARKVEKAAKPALFEAMDEFLASPLAQSAVIAQAQKEKAATDKAAADKAVAEKAAANKAAADKAAADKAAHDKAMADAKARNDKAAQERLASEQRARDAMEQARRAAEKTDQGKTFDNSTPKKDNPAVVVPGGSETPVVVVEPSGPVTKDAPALSKPTPVTTGGGGGGPPPPGDDMAELRQMKKEAEDRGGWRKYAAGGAGAVLGGLLGFFLGGLLGPVGAIVGAVIGAAAAGGVGFGFAKKYWG